MHRADVAVRGARMVGVSAALHLQARGRDVALIDRQGAAGLETSFGNAGLIERASFFPYLFPRELAKQNPLYAEPVAGGALPARPGSGATAGRARRSAQQRPPPPCGR